MSVAMLDAMFESARVAVEYSPEEKARSPVELLGGGGMGYLGDAGSPDAAQEQLGHYRGRFYSASRIIVHRVAMQPVYVARRRQRASVKGATWFPDIVPPKWIGHHSTIDVLSKHRLISLLADPNELMTSFNMWEMVTASMLVTGVGYIVAIPAVSKVRVFDLWAVPSTWMHQKDEGSFGQWIIKPPNSLKPGIPVDGSQVARFYFSDPNNPASVISPLSMIARAVLADEAIEGAQHSEFKNPLPKVALIAGDTMNEQSFTDDPNRTSSARPVRLEPFQRRQLVNWYQQQYSGVSKYGLPLILDAVIRDVKFLSRAPNEMAFMESAGLTKQNIFEALGVSKILTGQLDGTNRAGGGLAEQFLVDNTVNPMLTSISQVLTKKFGSLFADEGESLVCWIEEAEPRDPVLFLEKLRIAGRTYSIRRNEVRRLLKLNLPWVEGMDDVVIPQTMEEREGDQDVVGVGRLSISQQENKPADEA